jgi:predicted nuclease of restriction endonuclease-like (RecB) superfamily
MSSKAIVKQPVAQLADALPAGYDQFVAELKSRISAAQVCAALAVNAELVQLYWTIGRDISLRRAEQGWGTKVIDRLAEDLARAFPGIKGFSRANLYRMRLFYETWAGESAQASIVAQPVRQLGTPAPQAIVAQPVRQLQNLPPGEVTAIPWGHNVVLLQKLKSREQRLWYARQTIERGWSRSLLVHWIESDLYARQGKAITNFDRTLPPPQSDLARQLLKDPYDFDFLTLAPDAAERDLEKGLLDHVQKFLLELGAGFAFVGRQVPLEVEDESFSLDLLFFHLRLRCFVVIDLKTGDFKPEFSGKMNFYLSAVDDLMRHPDDKPSIGLILCKTAKKMVAEYALRDLAKPVGVARYVTRLVETLPDELAGALPSIEQIERELAKRENRLSAQKPPAKMSSNRRKGSKEEGE